MCVRVYHTASEVCLNLVRVCISEIQDMKLCTGVFQDSLTVQHALLKVGWFLKELELRVDLPKFPLHSEGKNLMIDYISFPT